MVYLSISCLELLEMAGSEAGGGQGAQLGPQVRGLFSAHSAVTALVIPFVKVPDLEAQTQIPNWVFNSRL